jgi:pimeloyl-ACP methyl ester carboxylesterase
MRPVRMSRLPQCLLAAFLIAFPASAADDAIDIYRVKPPGKMVDIGGRRLHLLASGKGGPAVVLEAGAGAFSFDWSLVQPAVARFTRVISYDRAGYAWSDAGPKPRTMRQVAFELRAALRKLGVKPPYVLVGHSLGGPMVRTYAEMYPNEVAGMVLVDATSEDTELFINGKVVRMRELSRGRPIPAVQETMPQAVAAAPEQQPEPRAKAVEPPFDKLPPKAQQWWLSARTKPRMMDMSGSEFDYLAEEFAAMYADKREHPLGDIPLAVLAGTRDEGPLPGITPEESKKLYEEKIAQKRAMTRLSTNNKYIAAAKSGHEIHLTEPEVVAQAIREVVEAARTGGRLKP